jgi:hypothetical protein
MNILGVEFDSKKLNYVLLVCDGNDVDFHRELTRASTGFPLRIDPCETLPLAGISGGYRSDRHGVFEHNPALGTA